jgi:hypothetical protein
LGVLLYKRVENESSFNGGPELGATTLRGGLGGPGSEKVTFGVLVVVGALGPIGVPVIAAEAEAREPAAVKVGEGPAGPTETSTIK